MVRMQVYRVGLDTQRRVPFVLLADADIELLLPIFIGPFEAHAIASVIEKVEFPRPLTHDLLRAVIEEVGYQVERVVVTALRDQTFYASLFLGGQGRSVEIDARPSDAIALALRAQAPIYVEEEVLEAAAIPASDIQGDKTGEDVQRLRELLGNLAEEPELEMLEGEEEEFDEPEEEKD